MGVIPLNIGKHSPIFRRAGKHREKCVNECKQRRQNDALLRDSDVIIHNYGLNMLTNACCVFPSVI